MFYLLIGFLGLLGTVIFGVSLLFDGLSAAKFKADDGAVPGLVKRSAKGSLKLFLISLAVFVVGLLIYAGATAIRP